MYLWLFKDYITKACLYNVDPLKPHFYIVKLGFTGVHIIFLISAQNNVYVLSRNIKKYQKFLSENFTIFGGKTFSIFE